MFIFPLTCSISLIAALTVFFPSYFFLPQSGLSLYCPAPAPGWSGLRLQICPAGRPGASELQRGLKVWKGVRIPTALVVWITRKWYVKAQPGAIGTNPPALLHNFPSFPKFTEDRQWLREKDSAQSQPSLVQHPQHTFSILMPALQGGQDRNAPFPQPLLSSRKSSEFHTLHL